MINKEELLSQLNEDIEYNLAQLEYIKKQLGKLHDHNSYGTGYDEGYLEALRYIKQCIESL